MNSIYVERKKVKLDKFLRRLANSITGTKLVNFSNDEGVYHLGSGYWKAESIIEGNKIVGARLINSDRTAE